MCPRACGVGGWVCRWAGRTGPLSKLNHLDDPLLTCDAVKFCAMKRPRKLAYLKWGLFSFFLSQMCFAPSSVGAQNTSQIAIFGTILKKKRPWELTL